MQGPARLRVSASILALLAAGALLPGCRTPHTAGTESHARPPFVLGADISALDAPGRDGRMPLRTFQEAGVPADEPTILRRHGWNAFRIRVFVPPVREAPDNTLEAAITLGRKIKAQGSVFLLCIHLSDTWADPQHQEIPVAWRGLDFPALEQRVEAYTYDTIRRLKDAGAMPDWVQVGNEITRGTLWPMAQVKVPGSTEHNPPEPYDDSLQWDHLTRILKAGIRGVLAAAGDTPPRIALHIDKAANWKVTHWFFEHVDRAGVPYDIIAESFYPEWGHGTLEQVEETMRQSARVFGKDFLIVETGYGQSHLAQNPSMIWPVTPEGRLQYMADIVSLVRREPRGIGVMYWAPEWEAWNRDGTPGPVVFTLERLDSLHGPESHLPPADGGP